MVCRWHRRLDKRSLGRGASLRCLSVGTIRSVWFESYCGTGLYPRCIWLCTKWACVDFRVTDGSLVDWLDCMRLWWRVKSSSSADVADIRENCLFLDLWSALREDRSLWSPRSWTLDMNRIICATFAASDCLIARTSTRGTNDDWWLLAHAYVLRLIEQADACTTALVTRRHIIHSEWNGRIIYLTDYFYNSNIFLYFKLNQLASLRLMVNESSAWDGVSHTSCLEGPGAPDEELKVAVDALVVQIKAVVEIVSVDRDWLLAKAGKVNLLGDTWNIEVVH